MSDVDETHRTRLETLFLEELVDNLRVLTDGLTALDQRRHVAGVQVDIDSMFRAAHSLKGAAHSAGIGQAVAPCHRLEDVFAELRVGTRDVDDALLLEMAEDIDALHVVRRQLGAEPPRAADDRPLRDDKPISEVRARVAVARLDQLVRQAGALLTTTQRVETLADQLRAADDAVGSGGADGRSSAVARLAGDVAAAGRELRRSVMQVAETAQELRLQPFRDVVTGLDEAVRELARVTGRPVRLVVDGGDVEVDRDVGDALREPLLHLVRNAIDHGVEDSDDRARAGKPPTATVRVSAAPQGRQIHVSVTDDGRGFDLVALRLAADARGVAAATDVDLAFLPGVSTASTLTEVSGRGIGLDAVRARIESMGGFVRVRSEPGRGTACELDVPVTLALLRVLVVDAAGHRVAVPVANVARVHHVPAGALEHAEGRLRVRVGDRHATAVPLARALGLTTEAPDRSRSSVALEIVGDETVLLVDGAHADVDVVLRGLPPRAAGSSAVLGAAILPDGEVAAVVNASTALRSGAMDALGDIPLETSSVPTVLLAEDSVTTRAMERSILESAGYEVLLAVDGAEAWEILRDRVVDIVVTDIDMPRMSGIELCRAMRASEHLATIPVVLVTSLASEDDRRRGLDAGADAYIVKSTFDQALLLDAVARLL